MKLLSKLNRRFGRYAIPNLTVILVVSQMFTYGLGLIRPEWPERLLLVPQKVLEGEWWRLISFLAYPPCSSPIFVIFFFYLFYLFGSALEATWGTFNYNLYLLVGYLAMVGSSFLIPEAPTYNLFLYNSLFLAFAYLYPNFTLCIMFVFPVKIKWLALLDWCMLGLSLLSGNWVIWVCVIASVFNFLVFFYKEIFMHARTGRRQMAQQVQKITQREEPGKPRHECSVCKATNITHPSLSFRYCSKCPITTCFCEDHLKDHRHEEEVKQAVG